MDVAYKQHANQARRKNRSSTNLNHLTLAPLTSKMPLLDHDALPDDLPDFVASPLHYNPSYLQGKSAPTTPRLLARSPARTGSRSRRSSIHASQADALPKSKSTTHLAGGRQPGALSPTAKRRNKDETGLSTQDRKDSDWLLRAGALISTETRESKGQAWLTARISSTSLTGMRDTEEEAYKRELAREKELASRRGSRRGSFTAPEDALLSLTSPNSRLGSRSHSRVGSKSMLRTPLDRQQQDEGYFVHHEFTTAEYVQGPDFVSLDEKLEAIEVDTTRADEATVRRLVKRGSAGMGSWMGNLIGFSLFSVEENDEESDDAEDDVSDAEEDESQLGRSPSAGHLEDLSAASEPRIPPPKADDGATSWQDAAWLLSVASKVLL
ncbi:hypothetical protein PG990_003452 [Apiospora arundinis]|uniref:DUF3984 domain-containing protein n=1 Tax=Apiospora arundinis TaxID=335852 RepID=A0ABR2IGY6_9PEZI